MKLSNRNKKILSFFAAALLLYSVALAQTGIKSRTLSLGGRDVTKKSDGMEIQVLKELHGKWALVGQNDEFRAGDKVRVQFWSNLRGHAYFINIAPSGKQKVIYSKVIEKDQDYTLPGRDGSKEMWIEFDNEKGVEILKLVMSPAPIKVFEDALARSQGQLGESVFSVSNELLSSAPGAKPGFEQVAMVQPQGAKAGSASNVGGCPGASRELGVKCRSLGFAPPDPKQGKGAVVVAIPDQKNPTGKLGKDDAIIVELRLKHI
jgi:Domain of unknown function (DUF4384)